MKVLVTGGTGFVGAEVVRELIRTGHTVRILARHPASKSTGSATDTAEMIMGDVTNPSSLVSALNGCDAIVHLVGIISEIGNTTFENVHVGGTENILRAAEAQGIGRFVHMSALGTRPGAVSRYHQTKWAAEEAVRSSRCLWTIFRPSLIYGNKDAFVNMFAGIARFSPVLPLLGRRDARFQPVSVQAVAAAFSKSISEPLAYRQTFDLCGPERLTLGQILNTILAVLETKRLILHIPNVVAQLQARLLEFIYPRLLRKPPPLNRDQLAMLQEGNEGNGAPADQLFALTHPRFREGIAYLGNVRA